MSNVPSPKSYISTATQTISDTMKYPIRTRIEIPLSRFGERIYASPVTAPSYTPPAKHPNALEPLPEPAEQLSNPTETHLRNAVPPKITLAPLGDPSQKKSKFKKPTSTDSIIRVVVINRLGKRVKIPCCPSETIWEFKSVAAARLGIRSGAVLLRRQGERVMKDSLTLADCEVGDGECLDLEVEMGD